VGSTTVFLLCGKEFPIGYRTLINFVNFTPHLVERWEEFAYILTSGESGFVGWRSPHYQTEALYACEGPSSCLGISPLGSSGYGVSFSPLPFASKFQCRYLWCQRLALSPWWPVVIPMLNPGYISRIRLLMCL
jgi:hypothetical protein